MRRKKYYYKMKRRSRKGRNLVFLLLLVILLLPFPGWFTASSPVEYVPWPIHLSKWLTEPTEQLRYSRNLSEVSGPGGQYLPDSPWLRAEAAKAASLLRELGYNPGALAANLGTSSFTAAQSLGRQGGGFPGVGADSILAALNVGLPYPATSSYAGGLGTSGAGLPGNSGGPGQEFKPQYFETGPGGGGTGGGGGSSGTDQGVTPPPPGGTNPPGSDSTNPGGSDQDGTPTGGSVSVPEPSSLLLVGLGIGAATLLRRRAR